MTASLEYHRFYNTDILAPKKFYYEHVGNSDNAHPITEQAPHTVLANGSRISWKPRGTKQKKEVNNSSRRSLQPVARQ